MNVAAMVLITLNIGLWLRNSDILIVSCICDKMAVLQGV